MRTGAVSARARKCRQSGPVRDCAGGARCPRGAARHAPRFGTRASQPSASPRRSSASRESGARGSFGRPTRRRGHGRLVRLRREPAARRDLRQALERAGLPVRRALGLGPRELVAPALVARARRRRARVRGHRGAVPEPRAARSPSPMCARPTPRSAHALQGTVAASARARPGAGRQRLRRPPRGRRASRPHAAERPPRGRAAADLRWAARVRDPPALPRRPARGLRHRVRGGRAARRRRPARPARRSAPASSTSRCSSAPTLPSATTTWSSWPTTERSSRPRTSPRSSAREAVDRVRHAPGRHARRGVGAADTETLRALNARAAQRARSASTASRWLDAEQLP